MKSKISKHVENISKNRYYPSVYSEEDEKHVYNLTITEIEERLKTSKKTGLTKELAKSLLEKYGSNVIKRRSSINVYLMFFKQFKDITAMLLLASGILSIFLNEITIGVTLLVLVLINGGIGFFEEYSANKSLEALNQFIPKKVKVIRDGLTTEIDSSDLVPGDLMLIGEGDSIAADARLIESYNLEAIESSLTGEATSVSKSHHSHEGKKLSITDMRNMVLMGTTIARGTGKAIVVGTGVNTEFGKIAHFTQESNETPSPLQKELRRVGVIIVYAVGFSGLIAFLIETFVAHNPIENTVILSIGLALSAIPEGLPATVGIALSIGSKFLAKKNVIVKQLTSVETLGSTTVIVSDKTGTLTKNQMSVTDIYTNMKNYTVTGTGYEPVGVINGLESINHVKNFFECMLLCNNSSIECDGTLWKSVGDPTESALVTLCKKNKYFNIPSVENEYVKLSEIPFDSDRKMMSTIFKNTSGSYIMYTKGGVSEILEKSKMILLDNNIVELTEDRKRDILLKNDEYANNALRVLAFAMKLSNTKLAGGEEGLIFLGLVGMIDPPRDNVDRAISEAMEAGIRIIMCTGDHPNTAIAIAKRINLIKNSEQTKVILGSDMNGLSDEELLNDIYSFEDIIFARSDPTNKLRVVRLLKSKGEVVAVTGDGVNDSPALKAADIGIAMGIVGTDVSKEASKMILLDDSFASIVEAIRQGRIIYNNIKKFIRFILSIDLAELTIFFLAILLGLPSPMFVLQLLSIDLVVNIIPSIILARDIGDPDIMKLPPRSRTDHLFDKTTLIPVAINGLLISVFGIIVFFISLNQNGWSYEFGLSLKSNLYFVSTTASYLALVIPQILVNLYTARSFKFSVFNFELNSYKYLFLGSMFCLILISLFILIPGVSWLFDFRMVNPSIIMYILGFSICIFILSELSKIAIRFMLHLYSRIQV